MIQIIDKPGTGKTKELLLLAQKNNAVVVCKNPRCMIEKCHGYGLIGIECISYEEFYARRGMVGSYVIDELEELIYFITGNRKNVIGYTLTQD